jgi:hypothetical protein
MKIYKVSWNNFFYWVILLSLQVESFMIKKNAHKMKRNTLKLYIISLKQTQLVGIMPFIYLYYYHFKLSPLRSEIYTKMNINALKYHP